MDPIVQTVIDFGTTLIENPVTGPAILSGVRAITGFLQLKWKGATGMEFSRKELGATLLKYEVGINAFSVALGAFGVNVDYKGIEALALVTDILGSFSRKLLKK